MMTECRQNDDKMLTKPWKNVDKSLGTPLRRDARFRLPGEGKRGQIWGCERFEDFKLGFIERFDCHL
jgi:hypothetical protein